MEIGQIYELSENISDAIDNYKSSFSIWEKIITDNNYDVLFNMTAPAGILNEKKEKKELSKNARKKLNSSQN